MMNKVSRSIFAGAALAMTLAGCQMSNAPANTTSGEPPRPVTNATLIPQMPKGDPSVPDAATMFAAQDSDAAKTMQDATALQQKPAPQEEMTKVEESTAMPLPGQGNDHSATALDKKDGGRPL